MPIKVWRYWGWGFAGSWEADHRVKLANLRWEPPAYGWNLACGLRDKFQEGRAPFVYRV